MPQILVNGLHSDCSCENSSNIWCIIRTYGACTRAPRVRAVPLGGAQRARGACRPAPASGGRRPLLLQRNAKRAARGHSSHAHLPGGCLLHSLDGHMYTYIRMPTSALTPTNWSQIFAS
eukprot:360853-Chlamydomonas_euryale.AAC.8